MIGENRLSDREMKEFTPLTLTDNVGSMVTRSHGIIRTLQSAVAGSEIQLDSGSIISALECVGLQIGDINALVRQYHKQSIGK